jgi:hypothetical protein
MVGGMASSGRVIFAAGAIMVAVFVTFALSGPLPPKEMGVILGVAVLLDAALVRLLLLPVLLRLLGVGVVPAQAAGPAAARRPLRPRVSTRRRPRVERRLWPATGALKELRNRARTLGGPAAGPERFELALTALVARVAARKATSASARSVAKPRVAVAAGAQAARPSPLQVTAWCTVSALAISRALRRGARSDAKAGRHMEAEWTHGQPQAGGRYSPTPVCAPLGQQRGRSRRGEPLAPPAPAKTFTPGRRCRSRRRAWAARR